MAVRGRLLLVGLVGLGAGALGGCILPEPSYDDTRFRCEEPTGACPDGFACVDGYCVHPGDADAAPGDDDPDPPADPSDAAPAGDPDARPAETASFGERTGADFDGVTHDTTLRENNPATTYGGDDIVSVDAEPIHIGLLRFDLSALPTGTEVVTAELEIYASDPIETGEYQLHGLLLSWNENQATYEERSTGVPWPAPGAGTGSFAPSVIGTLVAREVGAYTVILLPAAVQAWVSSPAQNFGMRWSSSSMDGRGGTWETSESGTDEYRPLLRITYR